MANHDINTFMVALVALITAAVPGFGLVRQGVVPFSSISSSDRPCLMLQEGGNNNSREMTKTTESTWFIGAQIITNNDDDYSAGRALYQAVTDALDANVDTNGASLSAVVVSGDGPFYMPSSSGNPHFINFEIQAVLRRDR